MVHRDYKRGTVVDQSRMIMQLMIPETLNALSTHLPLKQGRQNVTVLLASYMNVMGLPYQLYSTVYGQK